MSKFKKIPENAQVVFKGVLHDVYQWQQETFDGSFAVFEAIKRRDTVTVLATTTDKKVIVNFEEQPHRGSFIAIPGGVTEVNETLLENAKRELEEETGYVSESWELWQENDVLNNWKLDWMDYVYIAKNCEKKGKIKFDPGEKIETKLYAFDDFIEISQKEKFRNREVKNYIKDILEIENQDERNKKIEEFKKTIY